MELCFCLQVGTVLLYGVPIVSLYIEAQERLCLAQISNTLLKQFSYNEIHNRRVALGITCVQVRYISLSLYLVHSLSFSRHLILINTLSASKCNRLIGVIKLRSVLSIH